MTNAAERATTVEEALDRIAELIEGSDNLAKGMASMLAESENKTAGIALKVSITAFRTAYKSVAGKEWAPA